MNYFAGLDIGSTAIKIAIVDEAGKLAGEQVTPTGSLFYKNAKESFELLLTKMDLRREQVRYLIATGYGRKLYKEARSARSPRMGSAHTRCGKPMAECAPSSTSADRTPKRSRSIARGA